MELVSLSLGGFRLPQGSQEERPAGPVWFHKEIVGMMFTDSDLTEITTPHNKHNKSAEWKENKWSNINIPAFLPLPSSSIIVIANIKNLFSLRRFQ